MHQLRDTYNRHINYLRISVTDRCNLRCIYCMPKDGVSLIGNNDILSYEEMLRIANVAVKKGITKVRITGGEPLVRRGVVEFIGALSKIDGIQDLALTTNGILLYSKAKRLFDAGLKRLNISMDTLRHDRYRTITRGGDIKRVWAGIEKARETGFSPIKINIVAIRGINDDEILSFARLTLERNVHIRFIEFMPIGTNNGWEKSRFISVDELRSVIKQLGDLTPLPSKNGSGPARMFQIKQSKGQLGFISPMSNHFCRQCNRLRLTPDGKLRTCLFSEAEIDLKTPLRCGCSDNDLDEIIAKAILSKPMRHNAVAPVKKCTRAMSAIGG